MEELRMPRKTDGLQRPYVYVSYSREDAQFVSRLHTDLTKHGIRVWTYETEIYSGSDWRLVAQEGLRNASALLLVVSRHTPKSPVVMYEAGVALSQGQPVVPVLIDEEGKGSLSGNLAELRRVVAYSGEYQTAVTIIVEALSQVVPPARRARRRRRKSKWYLFISYAEEDTDFVTKLRAFLKDRDYAYWDYAESARNYNSQTVFEIEDAISKSAACLCVISESWRDSRWTIREYFYAEEVNRPGFLLKARPIRPSLAIAGSTYIDFTKNEQQGFARLDAALRQKGL
jgi:hypothetical protein